MRPVDSLTPVRLTLRAAFSSLPRSFPSGLGHLDLPGTLSGNPRKNLQQSRVDSRLPSASHPSGCLRQSTERLPRRLVHRRHSSSPSSRRPVVLWSARLARRAIPPDDAQQLMPSPPGVRHIGCTKAFL